LAGKKKEKKKKKTTEVKKKSRPGHHARFIKRKKNLGIQLGPRGERVPCSQRDNTVYPDV